MRVFYALTFIALICSSFAIQNRATQKALSTIKNAKMETKFGRTLQSFIKLADIEELSSVSDILDEVRGELQDLLSRMGAELGEITSAHDAKVSELEGQISNLKGQISTKETEESNAQDAIATTEAAIQVAAETGAQAAQDLAAENARRESYVAAFNKKVEELNGAISACDDALALLEQIRNKDLAAEEQIVAETSFAQVKTQFKSSVHKIREILKNHKADGSTFVMLQTLLEIAEAGVNAEIIGQLEQMIRELKGTLAGEITSAQAQNEADASAHADEVDRLQGIIDAQQAEHDRLTGILPGQKEALAAIQQTLATLRETLGKTETSLENENASFAETEQKYNAAMERLRKDIEVLGLALDYLESENLEE